MNHKLYHEKLRILRTEGSFNDQMISVFTNWVTKADDLDLLRINPLQVSAKLGIDSHELTDFFIHGSRAGLFDFSWSMICPSCGEIQNNDHSLNSLSGEFFCVVCQVPVKVNIDDTVEVTFSLNPSILPLNIDPFQDAQTYRRVFFSDAVMASFSRPADGVAAALEMQREIRSITRGNHSLGLKIGLHEGPALAINNQGTLDYFGQTVNIAARVQGLAGEDSIWMTEQVLRSKGSAQLLKDAGFSARRYQASLKGVGEKTTVFEMKKKEFL